MTFEAAVKHGVLSHVFSKGLCTKHYGFVGKIGEGAGGKVYLAKKKSTGEEVAIKVMNVATNGDELNDITELFILRKLASHSTNPHIMHMIDAFYNRKRGVIFLVLPLCTGGMLLNRIKTLKRYTEYHAAQVFSQLASAVRDMHSLGIVHRDLKPENILLRSDKDDIDIVLTDFGLSSIADLADHNNSHHVGSPGYEAPETLILVSGCPPFHGDTAHRHRSILQGKYDFPADYFRSVSSDAKDLIGWCLQVAPESRASMDDILSHQWLQSASKSAHLAARKEIGKYADKALFRTTLSAAAKQTNNLKSTRTLLMQLKDKYQFTGTALQHMHSTFLRVSPEDQHVTKTQFETVMLLLGFVDLPLAAIFDAFDADGNGLVDFKEFLSGLVMLQGRDEHTLKLLFDIYDIDGNGCLSQVELAHVIYTLNPKAVAGDRKVVSCIETLFSKLDSNNDGQVSFQEFRSSCEADAKLFHTFLKPVCKLRTSSADDADDVGQSPLLSSSRPPTAAAAAGGGGGAGGGAGGGGGGGGLQPLQLQHEASGAGGGAGAVASPTADTAAAPSPPLGASASGGAGAGAGAGGGAGADAGGSYSGHHGQVQQQHQVQERQQQQQQQQQADGAAPRQRQSGGKGDGETGGQQDQFHNHHMAPIADISERAKAGIRLMTIHDKH